jgi:hypothetical protein
VGSAPNPPTTRSTDILNQLGLKKQLALSCSSYTCRVHQQSPNVLHWARLSRGLQREKLGLIYAKPSQPRLAWQSVTQESRDRETRISLADCRLARRVCGGGRLARLGLVWISVGHSGPRPEPRPEMSWAPRWLKCTRCGRNGLIFSTGERKRAKCGLAGLGLRPPAFQASPYPATCRLFHTYR